MNLMITFCLLLQFTFIIKCIECVNSYSKTTPKSCPYGTIFNNMTCEDCGLSDYKYKARIVGGIETVPHSWPAQVLLLQHVEQKYEIKRLDGEDLVINTDLLCGGTLINRFTIPTAAHCVVKSIPWFLPNMTLVDLPVKPNPNYESMFTVYLGAHDISFATDNKAIPKTVQKLNVAKIIIHPEYNDENYLNDIALFLLSKPAILDNNVKFGCLPHETKSNFAKIESDCFAIGWGALVAGGYTANELRNVRLKVYDNANCILVFPEYSKNWDAQLCAGDMKGGKDTCQGDSGGGLYVLDESINKTIVVGITSYGDGCGQPKSPGIYTKVSYYLKWIKENWAIEDSVNNYASYITMSHIYLFILFVFTFIDF